MGPQTSWLVRARQCGSHCLMVKRGLLSQDEKRDTFVPLPLELSRCSPGLEFEFCFHHQTAGVTLSWFSKIHSFSLPSFPTLLPSPYSRIWV